MDNLAAVLTTHDWLRHMFKYILDNDNTMGEGERTGRMMLQFLHTAKFNETWDYATKLSSNAWNFIYIRYSHWFNIFENEGWIKFHDMR